MKNSIHRKINCRKSLQYIPLALVLMVVVYDLPPVQSRLGWHVDELYARIKYFFNPADQAVFRSEETDNFELILSTTRAEHWLTPTPALSETPVPTPGVTLSPTFTIRPLPVSQKIFRVM